MSVVTFTDYMPTPRTDGIPWTILRVEESTSKDGPWTQIDQINLVPVDADPAQPAARSFTSVNAVLTAGWYRLSFRDAAAHVVYADPIQNIPPLQSPWSPSLSDVGLIILARTRDSFGNELGTFTATTKPTEAQAARLIQKAALDVADVIGDDVPDFLLDDAKGVVAIRTAMKIETSYFPDQVNSGRSIYPQLKDDYEAAMNRLQRQLTLFAEGQTRVLDAGPAKSPSYSFPNKSSIGLDTIM